MGSPSQPRLVLGLPEFLLLKGRPTNLKAVQWILYRRFRVGRKGLLQGPEKVLHHPGKGCLVGFGIVLPKAEPGVFYKNVWLWSILAVVIFAALNILFW